MKNILHSKIMLILPAFIGLLCSCADNFVSVRVIIPPPPPDTTKTLISAEQISPDVMQADSIQSLSRENTYAIWPPEPDTTHTIVGNCQKIDSVDVQYYTSSPVKPDNIAYLMDSDNNIIDSVSATSEEKPVLSLYGQYYPTRVVFQLNKKVKSPMVKITIPDQPAFPNGQEILYIKFD
jgi:hypothetical protein